MQRAPLQSGGLPASRTTWTTDTNGPFDHQNVFEVTHERLGQLVGPTRLVYSRHLGLMASESGAVKLQRGDPRYDASPDRYGDNIERIEEPILFVSGGDNVCPSTPTEGASRPSGAGWAIGASTSPT